MGIDLSKYAGHTPGPWKGSLSYQWVFGPSGAAIANFNFASAKQENVSLIEDAPALLAEVVRLRADLAEAVQTLEAIESATRMRFSPAEILDENSPIREGMRAVLAKHGGDQ